MNRNPRATICWLSILLVTMIFSLPGHGDDSSTPSVLVALEPVRLQDLRETLSAYGTVEYSPDQAQVLDVQGEGLVSKVLAAAGQQVRQGEVLMELTPTVNGDTELEHARIAADYALRDFDRLKDLRSRQLATNAEVQTAEETLAKARSVLDSTRHRLGEGRLRQLRAGMDGFVEAVNVHVGDITAPGSPLLRLARGDRLRVRLGIEPEDLPRIKQGQTVAVRALYPDAHPVEGRIQHVYYQIDPKTRLAEAVVPLGAAPDLLPGAAVRGEVVLELRPQVPTVPRQAILTRDEQSYLFVADQGHAQRRAVETGLEDGDRIEVLEGVKIGESVVISGNYELVDGMAIRTGDAGR